VSKRPKPAAYSAYSGVVVDKGAEVHLLGRPATDRFLMLKNDQGHTFKKTAGGEDPDRARSRGGTNQGAEAGAALSKSPPSID